MKTIKVLILSLITATSAMAQGVKQYLTKEADLAPFRELILWKNAQQLFQIKQ